MYQPCGILHSRDEEKYYPHRKQAVIRTKQPTPFNTIGMDSRKYKHWNVRIFLIIYSLSIVFRTSSTMIEILQS